MGEDRLDQTLEAMRNENISPEELSGARTRVWEKLGKSAPSACGEFQPSFRNYLDGSLTGSRRLLMDDHLSRCRRCRTLLAELRGERKIVPPAARRMWWPQWGTWAAVASLVLVALYLTRDRVDTMLAPSGARATVASISGVLHRVPDGVLQAGAAIGDSETVRTGPGARAVLRLADESLLEVNERTELLVRGAWSGQTIQLQRGDVIVQAAKQRRGQLRVQTRDSVASVKGTVFAVSVGFGGTVVSVVEGSVAVAQPGVEVVLKPGEQQASSPALAHSVQEAVSWSPDAEKYISLLASFAKIEKEIAALPSPALRTQGRLLQYLPDNMVIYGALPNLGGTIKEAIVLVEQQSVENPVLREWWNSDTGQDLRRLVDNIQSVTPLLGDEIVFGFATIAPKEKNEIPLVAAEVLPGKRAELARALDSLRTESGGTPLPYSLTEKLMVASDSQANLKWVIDHLGQGAASPFATAIAARYERGAGWLLGLDMEPALAVMSSPEASDLIVMQQMKHLFFEQRSLQGTEENGVTLTFKGPRMGMASWLASSGSGGAAEYVSRDAIFALYLSTREPRQLFEELIAQLAKSGLSGDLDEVERKLGVGFARDLAAAIGTESAFALEGFSVTGPVWVMAVLANDPTTLDNSVRKLVETFNSELGPEDQLKRITIVQETADGRKWTTLKTGTALLSVTWTHDRGYLVAASDRGAAARALATRSGGASLVWSTDLRQRLPSSAGLHPSAFAWLNTKGVLQGFEALVPNATLQKLIAERDPILIVFSGTTEQIHAASRTRLTGLILDVMMLESLSRTRGAQAAILQHGRAQPGRH
jgi:FecR protein